MSHIYCDHNGVRVFTPVHQSEAGNVYYVEFNDATVETIHFQTGSPLEHGINGVTNEHLLGILIDRTKRLDAKMPSAENRLAIASMTDALNSFEARTKNRINRGVEGTPVA